MQAKPLPVLIRLICKKQKLPLGTLDFERHQWKFFANKIYKMYIIIRILPKVYQIP